MSNSILGKKYKVIRLWFGWLPNEEVEIVEEDNPTNYVDVGNGIYKTCIKRKELDQWVADGTLIPVLESGLELDIENKKCYTCTWKRYKGFRWDYDYCSKCGRTREDRT